MASTLGSLLVFIFSFPPLGPLWCYLLPFCDHFQCWLGLWLLRLWRCLTCLLWCSQFRLSLHRLGLSMSIPSLLSSEKLYSWFCTFLMLPILPRFRLFGFQFELKFGRCRFHRVYVFPYFRIKVSHQYRVVVCSISYLWKSLFLLGRCLP